MAQKYQRIFRPVPESKAGLVLYKQDEVPGTGNFPSIRKLKAHRRKFEGAEATYFVQMELWRDAPLEYPPAVAGSAVRGVGLDLTREEAAALWYSLGEFLVISPDEPEVRHYVL